MGKKRRRSGIIAFILAAAVLVSPMRVLDAGGNSAILFGADLSMNIPADQKTEDDPAAASGNAADINNNDADGDVTVHSNSTLENGSNDADIPENSEDTAVVQENSEDAGGVPDDSPAQNTEMLRAANAVAGETLQLDPNKYYIIYDAYDEKGVPLDASSANSRVMFDNGGNSTGWLKYGSSWNRSYYSKYLWKFTKADDEGTYYMRSQGATTAFGVLSPQAGVAAGGSGAANFVVSDKNIKHPGSPMKFVVMAREGDKTYVAIQSTAYTDDRYGASDQVRYMATENVAMNATLDETSSNVRSYVTWVDRVDETDRTAGWWVIEEIGETLPGGIPGSTRLFHTKPMEVHYRIPAITTTNGGDVLAVADYRYDSGSDIGLNWPGWNGTDNSGYSKIGHRIDQVGRMSTDNGGTWEAERNITQQWSYPGVAGTKLANGYGDPALVSDRDSDKVLLATVGGSYGFSQQNAGIVTMLSTDGGRTFQAPTAVGGRTTGTAATETISDTGLYALDEGQGYNWWTMFITSGRMTQSRHIKLGDYYRIYCAPLVKVNSGGGANLNWVLYSDDFGTTWKVLPGAAITGADEAKVEELPNGNVVITSRTSGGRKVNIFTYDTTDPTRSTGSWGTQSDLSIGHATNPANGELYIVYAKNNQTQEYGYLALQTFPAADNSQRQDVRVFYKWLDPNTSTPAEFASGWDKANSYTLQKNWSCYSVITLQADGNLGLVWEENQNQYDIVYKSVSVNELTNGAYSIAFHAGIGSKDTPYVVSTVAEAKAVLATYANEGVHWHFEGDALDYVRPKVSDFAVEAVRTGNTLNVTTAPVVTDSVATIAQGWQIQKPGQNWTDFTTAETITAAHIGAKLRYYAENAYAVGYSEEVTIREAAAITLTANQAFLTGGGKVTLTVDNLLENEKVSKVTCDNGITVTGSSPAWTATLPDKTAKYTFTATVDGKAVTCEVSVTASAQTNTPGTGDNTGSSTGKAAATESSPNTAVGSNHLAAGTTGARRDGRRANFSTKKAEATTPGTAEDEGKSVVLFANSNFDYENEHKIVDSANKTYRIVSVRVETEQKDRILQTLEENKKDSVEIQRILEETAEENRVIMEIHLKELNADREVQPQGKASFLVQYPKNSNKGNQFTIIHLEGERTPVVLAEDVDYKKEEEGLFITVDSFSPFIISWEDTAEAQPTEVEQIEVGKTEDTASEAADTTAEPDEKKESNSAMPMIVLAVMFLIACGGYVWHKKKRN